MFLLLSFIPYCYLYQNKRWVSAHFQKIQSHNLQNCERQSEIKFSVSSYLSKLSMSNRKSSEDHLARHQGGEGAVHKSATVEQDFRCALSWFRLGVLLASEVYSYLVFQLSP